MLVSVDLNCVRLLCDVGAAPACAVGSSCTNYGGPYGQFNGGGYGGFGFGGGCGCGCGGGFGGDGFIGNPLGSIAVIPTCAIACFTHNAI